MQVPVCVLPCEYVLRAASTGRILCFINTLMIIMGRGMKEKRENFVNACLFLYQFIQSFGINYNYLVLVHFTLMVCFIKKIFLQYFS